MGGTIMIDLYKRSYQARRWIKYAVIPSFIPIALIIAYDAYLGYTIKNIVNRHLIDFILVVFAIAVSAFGSAINLHKKVKLNPKDAEKSEDYILISVVVGIWCCAFFTLLYDKLKPEDSLSFRKVMFCVVQIIITYFIVNKGMHIEND